MLPERVCRMLTRLGLTYSQARHANLLERLKVLALLHWGAPRPLSKAERDFARQLEVRRGEGGQQMHINVYNYILYYWMVDYLNAALWPALRSWVWLQLHLCML